MADYGYCRVSSRDQNLDRQLIAMEQAGIERKYVICDKESGKDFFRPEWLKLRSKLKKGDTLTIMSLDRLGRNYDEVLRQWRMLTEKDIGIVVLDMPILNTAKDRDLTGRLIADIVLQLLAYVAETERAYIKKRQREGIDAAMARGVRFGKPPGPLPEGFAEMITRLSDGELTMTAAAEELGIPRSSLYHYIKRWRREV